MRDQIPEHTAFYTVRVSAIYRTGGSQLVSFPGGSVVQNPSANAGNMGWIPGWARPPGGGNGNPLQYSYLKNPMDRGARRATIHGVTKSQTGLGVTKSQAGLGD